VAEVDEFLYKKIQKKLQYWSSLFLSLAARAINVNSILLSTTWFFIHIWGGSDKVIRRIRGFIRDYLWSDTVERSQARVRWNDCYTTRLNGGLGIIDPDEALIALTSKSAFPWDA
jgi:hypothetical protein